jgi:hypothetical protein
LAAKSAKSSKIRNGSDLQEHRSPAFAACLTLRTIIRDRLRGWGKFLDAPTQ